MRKGKVLYGCQNGVHVIRYVGGIGYMIAPSLKQFFEELLNRPDFKGMVFDVSRTTAMDSTNLGLLARTGLDIRARFGTPPLLVCLQSDLREFLRSMSFHEIFHMADQYWGADEVRPVQIEAPSEGALLHVMLEAHRSLINMSEDNRERFEEVVVWLEAEQDKHQPS